MWVGECVGVSPVPTVSEVCMCLCAPFTSGCGYMCGYVCDLFANVRGYVCDSVCVPFPTVDSYV